MGQIFDCIENAVYNAKWTLRSAIYQRQVEAAFRRVRDLHVRRYLCELWYLLKFTRHTFPYRVAASIGRLQPYRLPELQDITDNWITPPEFFLPGPHDNRDLFFGDKLPDDVVMKLTDLRDLS